MGQAQHPSSACWKGGKPFRDTSDASCRNDGGGNDGDLQICDAWMPSKDSWDSFAAVKRRSHENGMEMTGDAAEVERTGTDCSVMEMHQRSVSNMTQTSFKHNGSVIISGKVRETSHGSDAVVVHRTWKNSSINDNEVKYADSMPDADTVRRIDAGVLNFKHLFVLSVLVLLASAVTYLNVDVNL
ncbi:hypothetical protein E2542_SST07859 [Spatholobus suberectus]|nr:hypothetical protein E2542_SST07859 [Spatholobus suberectus]